jgi:nucleoside 2-deoxyribosyltransferase
MKIYLACPYSHPRESVREARVRLADRVAARLVELGHIVFSPLTHSHRIAHHLDNHLDLDCWLRQDLAFLEWADILYILTIPGWEDSKGVAAERAFWSGPVKMLRPEEIL